jgi:hypothetical protein
MREPVFDYQVRLERDVAWIAVPHHVCRGNTSGVAVAYTLEVLVDVDVYERLKVGNARLGVSYAGGRTPNQRLLARARLYRMEGVTRGQETYPLPWVVLGRRPEAGMMADHVNGDGLDNRRTNLRWVTHDQNMQNRRGWGKASQTMGVNYNRSTGKWLATVVKVCKTRDEAEQEAVRMHAMMYGQHARGKSG